MRLALAALVLMAVVAALPTDVETAWAQAAPTSGGASVAAVPSVAAGMKLVFEDDFPGTALDLKKWYPGPKPDGGQWGGAFFVDNTRDPAFADAYHVEGGVLRLRARYDAAYRDPQGYGRKWRGAEISTAFPNGRVSGAARHGYFEARMKLPYGEGAWPAWWMLNVAGILKGPASPGDAEIDVLEAYGQWIKHGGYLITIHDFNGPANTQFHSDAVTNSYDLGADFHDYGCLFTEKEVIMYFDGKELGRAPLPKAATIDKFYALLDMSIDNDPSRHVTIPASGVYDLLVQHVRIWSAD